MFKSYTFLNEPKMIKKFCEDYNLPIKIFEKEYFIYFLELYFKHLKLESKMNNFEEVYLKYGKDGLKKKWHEIKDNIVLKIKEQNAYEKLKNEDFSKDKFPQYNKFNPYNDIGAQSIIVSIDIKQANFNCLKSYDKSLVLNNETYEGLIEKEGNVKEPYFSEIKILRQLIFEQILSNKIAGLQKRISMKVIDHVKKQINPKEISLCGTDECLFLFDKKEYNIDDLTKKFNEIIKDIPNKEILKLEIFYSERIIDDYWKKVLANGEYTLRKTPSQVYAQVFKINQGLKIEENDLLFMDGQTNSLCKFLKPLKKD